MGGNKAARRRLQRLARPLAIHPSRRRLCLAYDLRQQKKGRNHLDYGAGIAVDVIAVPWIFWHVLESVERWWKLPLRVL
jgi:hypothetical protein